MPLEFIDRIGPLSWPAVQFGLREGWLRPGSAIDLAVRKVVLGSDISDEVELAGLLPGDFTSVPDLVARLARDQPASAPAAKSVWLRLLIAWLYENRTDVADPFDVIEEIYVTFGYPEEIRHLIRHNSTSRPLESKEHALSLMLDDWAEYVRNVTIR
jgi:hypothetical protein